MLAVVVGLQTGQVLVLNQTNGMHDPFTHTGAREFCMRTSCDAGWICALPCAETYPRVLLETSMRLCAASCKVHTSVMIGRTEPQGPRAVSVACCCCCPVSHMAIPLACRLILFISCRVLRVS